MSVIPGAPAYVCIWGLTCKRRYQALHVHLCVCVCVRVCAHRRSKELNITVRNRPNDIEAWLSLVRFQDEVAKQLNTRYADTHTHTHS